MTVASQPVSDPLHAFARGLGEVLAEPGRIGLVYQPIVDLARGGLAGYETLARFDAAPTATPDRWFEAAEALGLADELEALVITQALKARDWLPPNCFLSINVGPRSACSEPVRRSWEQGGDLSGVVFEITEQSPVDDYARLSAALRPARGAGAAVAVDDAGAGFASLRHVTELRPDFVKVDRALVANLDVDPANAAIVEMLGVLAGRLDAWIIAEGVEREAELSRLIELGVPLAQGYGLARPAPAMQALKDSTEALLTTLRRLRDGVGVGSLSEPCPALDVDATTAELADTFANHREVGVVALIDRHQRPLALLSREAFLAGDGPVPVSLSVEPISDLAEVARRAMTRPIAQRFDPLACCDERGRMLGVLRVERLVEALAR